MVESGALMVSPKLRLAKHVLSSRRLGGARDDRREVVRLWLLLQLGLGATGWAVIAGLLSFAA
jgi:hypothetical protein